MVTNATLFVAMPFDEFQERIEKMIDHSLEKFINKPSQTQTEELLSIEEVCALLHVSKVTIHKWKKRKLILSYRIGRKIYFKKQELINSMKLLTYKLKRND